MSVSDVRPTTIESIKRLAKTLKKADAISHHDALDLAAKRAGYECFHHARNQLTIAVAKPFPFQVFVTAYWDDGEGSKGRETRTIGLSVPLRDIAMRGKIAGYYRLRHFRIDADDHLESANDIVSQELAQMVVNEACRALFFMDVTGLRPGDGRGLKFRPVPNQDHTHYWTHKPTDAGVLADEPYYGERLLKERREWAADEKIYFSTTAIRLYNEGTDPYPMFFASNSKEALDAISRGIEESMHDLEPADRWAGESASYTPIFRSPAQLAGTSRKRQRPKPINFDVPTREALPYFATPFGGDVLWRPAAKMPMEVHKEVGDLINGLLDMEGSYDSPLQRLCFRLDTWLGFELNEVDALGESQTKIYNRGSAKTLLPKGTSSDQAFERIAALVLTHYPQCVPVRQFIRQLDSARASFNRTLSRKRVTAQKS